MKHQCRPDCPVCERIAEERAEGAHYTPSDEEQAIRKAEARYERWLFGD